MNKFKTLKDHVYDYIAEEIIHGNILPNEKINENVICQKMAISRTPVREALIQLASEGILENVPRKGFVIRSMGLKEASEIYEVIGCLDGMAAQEAVNGLTEKDFMDMEFYIQSMDLAIDSGNYDMYHKQQHAFHHIYIDKCGNDTLIEELNKLRSKFFKKSYVYNSNEETKIVLHRTNDEHRQMLKMFKDRQGDELAKYISHIHWSPDQARFDLMDYFHPEGIENK